MMKDNLPGEFEDLLKERSDQYLIYPSDRVWNNVEEKVHGGRTWVYVSMVFLLSSAEEDDI